MILHWGARSPKTLCGLLYRHGSIGRRTIRSAAPALSQTSNRPSNIGLGQTAMIMNNNKIINNSNFNNVMKKYSRRTFSSDDLPYHIVMPMPALSPTMESGVISKWNLEEGQSFSAGDVLCEIQTDKASMDFEAQDDGVLAKILKGEGSEQEIGVPICVIVEDEDDVNAFKDFVSEEGAPSESSVEETAPSPEPTSPATATTSTSHDLGEFVLTPAARHNSVSKGVDASVLYPGSGKGGRVTKGDFLLAMQNGVEMPPLPQKEATALETTPAATAVQPESVTSTPEPLAPPDIPQPDPSIPFEDIANNNMRKVIAKRLTESKRDVPHFYSTMSIPLDSVLSLRKKLKKQDIQFSVNDAIIRASSLALRDVPEMNASFDEKSGTCTVSENVDISVAVATPTGLITPIVTKASERGLVEINGIVRDLATRARDNKLAPHEFQGGSFTISNLGMFGINEFSAVINPPQCAILAVGGGVPTIVPSLYDESATEQKKPQIQTLMEARLSADRRVVDEAIAGLFLQSLKYYLSRPELLML